MITILKETMELKEVDGADFRAAIKALGQMSQSSYEALGLTECEGQRASRFFRQAREELEKLDSGEG